MEALVNPKTGEVICIKKDGARWGREEKRLLQIVDWKPMTTEDRAIEAQLNGSKAPDPVVVHPYTKTEQRKPFAQAPTMDLPVLEEVGEVDGHKVYENACSKYCDLTGLDADTRRKILDENEYVPKITTGVTRPTRRPSEVKVTAVDIGGDVEPLAPQG